MTENQWLDVWRSRPARSESVRQVVECFTRRNRVLVRQIPPGALERVIELGLLRGGGKREKKKK